MEPKSIDESTLMAHCIAEMFVNSTKPMTAAAAIKRAAWHVIVRRRVF
jgi:hypothetical protein